MKGNYGQLKELAQQQWDLLTAKRQIEYIFEHPNQFFMKMSDWQQDLVQKYADLDRRLAEVNTATTKCRADPDQCELPPTKFDKINFRYTQLPPRFQAICGEPPFAPMPGEDNIKVYPLIHVGGDAEMDGHSPYIRIEGRWEPAPGETGLLYRATVRHEGVQEGLDPLPGRKGVESIWLRPRQAVSSKKSARNQNSLT